MSSECEGETESFKVDEIDPADEAADDAAMAEYLEKGGISHKAMMAWIRSWGTENELPSPQIGD